MPTRILIRSFFVLALLVAGFFAVRSWMEQTAIVVPVAREDAPNAAPGTVTVYAERSAEVRSEVSGRIAESNLKLAEPVGKGAVLIQLDVGELRIQIAHDEAEIKAAKQKLEIGNPSTAVQLQNAKDELAYNERMLKDGAVGAQAVERSRRGVEQLEQQIRLDVVNLEQQVSSLETNLALNKRRLGLMTITSPISGVVAEVNSGVGDFVTAGVIIGRVTSDARIVEAKVSEENFAGVKTGQTVSVRFTQYGNRIWTAKVTKILPEADPQTQRYRVHLEVEIDREKLVPGITGEASILLDMHPNVLVIPRVALMADRVFVVKDGVVELRRVKIGFTSLNAVEITAGLSEGDMVIVEDLDRFRDDDKVRTKPWTGEEGE